METTLSREDVERIASLSAVKVFGLIKDLVNPKEEKIKTNRSYSTKEVSEIFRVSPHTIRYWFGNNRDCLLKKQKGVNKFSGTSVKAEYERIHGKN
ncbi:helix-turn-helix domain-containing protein [Flavobacterium sp. CBA20B-1]|uniref:helix-turn-helix domain-containing protein n=1 Tax=unclassified Flavobacterium TaxID=196869 RepID=UPI00222454BB|nr:MULTISPECIES: helix-turn-helix domain-containing protein [unclassified Flavobacterium]WCM42449.1 helix-turn-helix domain-containing protein [Flavobacterium sp. CBA20B-1]